MSSKVQTVEEKIEIYNSYGTEKKESAMAEIVEGISYLDLGAMQSFAQSIIGSLPGGADEIINNAQQLLSGAQPLLELIPEKDKKTNTQPEIDAETKDILENEAVRLKMVVKILITEIKILLAVEIDKFVKDLLKTTKVVLP